MLNLSFLFAYGVIGGGYAVCRDAIHRVRKGASGIFLKFYTSGRD